jgi:hypothetical protein
MAVDYDFPDVRRRIHFLETQISDIERMLSLARPDAETQAAIYRMEQASRELQQLEYLLRFYQRHTNGALNKMQMWLFLTSFALSALMLGLYILERIK